MFWKNRIEFVENCQRFDAACHEYNATRYNSNTTINNIYDSFYESYSIDLTEYIKDNKNKKIREYSEIKSELTEVKSGKHSLGSVNLMAIEEAVVFIDGERVDLLPGEEIPFAAGLHTVLIKIGTQTITKKIDVKSGKRYNISLFFDIEIKEN